MYQGSWYLVIVEFRSSLLSPEVCRISDISIGYLQHSPNETPSYFQSASGWSDFKADWWLSRLRVQTTFSSVNNYCGKNRVLYGSCEKFTKKCLLAFEYSRIFCWQTCFFSNFLERYLKIPHQYCCESFSCVF